MPDLGGIMDAVLFGTIITALVSLAVPIIIVIVVVWAIRRSAPARRDPAEEALRQRLARGEIDRAEFLVRMRALNEGDDEAIV